MSEARKFQAIKGVRDILPPESALWSRVEKVAREVFATYGFGEILLPIFEETELFASSIGAETDIVAKEMFTWNESGTPIESALRAYWLLTHLNEFKRVDEQPVFDNQARPDLVVRTPSGIAVVEFKRKTISHETITNIRQYRKTFQQQFPDETSAKFVLVFAEPPSDFVRRLASANGVDIEVVNLPEYEPRLSLTLRPEATASVVRAYIEHGMHTQPGDVKLYYLGPMFRRERPQKGRYRQFYQIGAEVLGQSDHPGIDADVIEMVLVFIERCGLVGHTLYINSIGCRECRPKYVELLRAALIQVKDELGPDSQRRIETNPLRVLDSKVESEQAVIENLPRIADHLCPACREHFKMLQAMLFMRHIAYEVNWRLVRGLDYYMRTTFEITAPGLGAQNAVCGGGRYDGLVELLGGPKDVKGIGFALGTDRLILALQEAGKGPKASGLDAYVAWMGANAYPVAVRIARTLRDAGFSVELPHEEMKFKKSLGLAARLDARFAVILGDNEVAEGTAAIKRMADGTQQTVAENALSQHLRRLAG